MVSACPGKADKALLPVKMLDAMKKLLKLFLLLTLLILLTVGGIAVFVHSTDKQVVVLKDGSFKTVDEIWESGSSIFYEVDGDIFLLEQYGCLVYPSILVLP